MFSLLMFNKDATQALAPELGGQALACPPAETSARSGVGEPHLRTHIGPLRHIGVIGFMQKLRRVVINVLDLDNEF